MKGDITFEGCGDPDSAFDLTMMGQLSIVTDPEYNMPGRMIVGLAKYGEYQNIVLDYATVINFANALITEAKRRKELEEIT